jgi:hypothetical protein
MTPGEVARDAATALDRYEVLRHLAHIEATLDHALRHVHEIEARLR